MKKILLILFLLSVLTISGMAASYTTVYPTAHTTDYVKATSVYSDSLYPADHATDPAKSLTGAQSGETWLSSNGSTTEQRFHIDLGSAKIIRRIYYENLHHEGTVTNRGVENFTFWGSNTGSGTFDDLVYANDGGWTELTVSQNTFDEHVGADQADPKYITVTNTTAYRYYAFKFADNWGGTVYMGCRHIAVQTEDGYGAFPLVKFGNVAITKWNNIAISKWNNQ